MVKKKEQARFFVLNDKAAREVHAAIEFERGMHTLEGLPHPPGWEHFVTLLETAMWASLETEEGNATTFRLGWEGPQPEHDLVFSEPVPLTEQSVRKLAPVLTPGRVLLVREGKDGRALQIRGIGSIPQDSLEIKCLKPGVILVWYMYATKLVLMGGRALVPGSVSILDLIQDALPPGVSGADRPVTAGLLVGLIAELRRAGTGGTVVVLPSVRWADAHSAPASTSPLYLFCPFLLGPTGPPRSDSPWPNYRESLDGSDGADGVAAVSPVRFLPASATPERLSR